MCLLFFKHAVAVSHHWWSLFPHVIQRVCSDNTHGQISLSWVGGGGCPCCVSRQCTSVSFAAVFCCLLFTWTCSYAADQLCSAGTITPEMKQWKHLGLWLSHSQCLTGGQDLSKCPVGITGGRICWKGIIFRRVLHRYRTFFLSFSRSPSVQSVNASQTWVQLVVLSITMLLLYPVHVLSMMIPHSLPIASSRWWFNKKSEWLTEWRVISSVVFFQYC